MMWAKWSAASQTWSAPLALLSDLPYRLSQSLSGVSNRAVYAWTRDLDGVLTNAADQQVFYCAWEWCLERGHAVHPPTRMGIATRGCRSDRTGIVIWSGRAGRT